MGDILNPPMANAILDKRAEVALVPSDSESDEEFEDSSAAKKPKGSIKRRAQEALFSTWLSQRRGKITQEEVQAAIENANEETLSIRSLMAKQESQVIITNPREYQLELFEKAKKQNIIAVLDTGSGKTLIAVLLLKHVLDQELESRAVGKKPRVSFFLLSFLPWPFHLAQLPNIHTDCVTLVFQQFAVLERNLDQKVDRYCGEMGCDFWSKATWTKIFSENMVIVCTAQILYQCLLNAFISIDEINLLIFDEAHHTKKNHAYARIIKDFYIPHLNKNSDAIPKLFGMTASPVDARTDVVKAAKELEAMLHCQIATTSDLSLLRNSVSRPNEDIAVHKCLEYAYDTPLSLTLKGQFEDLEGLSKAFRHARAATSQLGDWCADQIWRFALAEEESKGKVERKMERLFLRDQENRSMEVLDKELLRLKEAEGVVRRWGYKAPTFEGNNISPKVKLLHEYLNMIFERPTDARCIIFVKHRYTARLLAKLFQQIGSPYMHLDVLIGSRAGEIGDVKFSFRQQVMTLMKFKKGELNCLFATSIAEEGLDIPDCNLVIRFDLYDTLIQYIQSRGRARHGNSKYIHMVEDGNAQHVQAVRDVRLGEQVMRQFCEALPADRLLQGDDYKLETALEKEMLYRKWEDPETGATLTYASALVVLAHFVGCLPHRSDNIQQPTYSISVENRSFICEVMLPENSPLPSAVGKPCPRKSLAKRSAAFEACCLLRGKGYLDSNLIPTYHKYLPQMRNAHLALNSKRTNLYPMMIKPKLWESTRGSLPQRLWMTVIQLEKPENLGRDAQPLVLLTRTRLPDFPPFPLHLHTEKISNILCSSLPEDMLLTSSRLGQLTEFTLLIYKDIYNKTFERNEREMTYWLAPVYQDWQRRQSLGPNQSPELIIDWTLVDHICQASEISWKPDMPNEDLLNRYLIDRWDGGRRFFSIAIEPGLGPRDPVPADAASHKYMHDISDYTVSLFAKSKARAKWSEDQPVIRAERVLHRLNLLDELSEKEKSVNTRSYLCAEPLKISALPVSVVSMGYLFSAIMHRLDSYLIALEAFDLLGLSARTDLALEALTKDSDNTEEHRSEQIHVQRGMGKNYERLEFIGDCFLKMATSITLFSSSPEDNEFEYHVRRMLMICNSNLLQHALKNGLTQYIRSKAFSRRNWYPQGIKLLEGKGHKKTGIEVQNHTLGDKPIADVCEAMIGASLLSYKDEGNLDVAVKAVTVLVGNEDHQVCQWADYYPLYTKPKYQLADSTSSQIDLARQIERIQGYHFKYPRLLRSAFIHPSYPSSTERIPNYQRLEFLGDALLDMACVNFLFERYPDKDPQWLTEHKMAMVSNKFLAALSVKLGFHKHLRSLSAIIEIQNREYAGDVEEAERDAKGARDYWTNTKQPPKALSDIVEAYIGAVFVDSEFNFAEVERFFDKNIRWFFEDMSIYDTFANNHPITYIHNLMTLTFGCTNYRLMASEIPSIEPGGPPTSVAGLMIHDEIIAEGQASSTKNAKIKASSAAVKLLQGLAPFEYRVNYHCDCEGEEKQWVGKDGGGIGMVGTAI